MPSSQTRVGVMKYADSLSCSVNAMEVVRDAAVRSQRTARRTERGAREARRASAAPAIMMGGQTM